MKYVLLSNRSVMNIIPEYDPAFPNIPLSKRFSAAFIRELIPVSDDIEVRSGMVYDIETGEFREPPEPELTEDEELEIEVSATQPTKQAATDAMLVDHELRITMLEMGL